MLPSRAYYALVLTFTWLYLLVFWLGVQFYVYPALIRLEKPRALAALRTAALGAWANPTLLPLAARARGGSHRHQHRTHIPGIPGLAGADGAAGGALVQAVP